MHYRIRRKEAEGRAVGFAVAGFAYMTGTPLAGALVHANDGLYLYVQMWAGLSILTGRLYLSLSNIAADRVMSKAAETENVNGQSAVCSMQSSHSEKKTTMNSTADFK